MALHLNLATLGRQQTLRKCLGPYKRLLSSSGLLRSFEQVVAHNRNRHCIKGTVFAVSSQHPALPFASLWLGTASAISRLYKRCNRNIWTASAILAALIRLQRRSFALCLSPFGRPVREPCAKCAETRHEFETRVLRYAAHDIPVQ